VTERIRRALGAALVPTLALGGVLVAAPGYAELAVHVWLLSTLAIGLVAVLVAVRDAVPALPSSFDAALAPRTSSPARPPSLAKLEREVSMGAENAFDTYFRLRPLFRDVTASLLLARHGIDLGRHPDRAHAVTGAELWELVRPSAEAPTDRGGPGVPAPTIEAAVADLERIAWS
jgi:hypothetical protein